DFGKLLGELRAVALREASGNHQTLAMPAALDLGGLEDCLDRFLFGRLDEGAGVDQQHLRLRGIERHVEARTDERAQHQFAVSGVFRAPEAYEVDALHSGQNRGLYAYTPTGSRAIMRLPALIAALAGRCLRQAGRRTGTANPQGPDLSGCRESAVR